MNPLIKAKWVAALRSGNYKQGAGFLRQGNNFCCLGVLCDLYAKENGEGSWHQAEPHTAVNLNAPMNLQGFRPTSTFRVTDSYSVLPDAVLEWCDLTDPTGPLLTVPEFSDSVITLPFLNDLNVPFSKIATIIEENL